MGIIVWILDKLGINILFKIALMLLYLGVIVVLVNIFINLIESYIADIAATATLAGTTINILAAILPSNTATLLSLVLLSDLAVMGYRVTMNVLSIKRGFLTGN